MLLADNPFMTAAVITHIHSFTALFRSAKEVRGRSEHQLALKDFVRGGFTLDDILDQ
jgi:hypothetical protein